MPTMNIHGVSKIIISKPIENNGTVWTKITIKNRSEDIDISLFHLNNAPEIDIEMDKS